MMRETLKATILAISAVGITSGCNAGKDSIVVENNTLEICENAKQALDASGLDLNQKIERWISHGDQCKGSGFYEYHLCKLYIQAGMYDRAQTAIKEGLSFDSSFTKELELSKGDIYLRQQQYSKAETEYRKTVEHFPDWFAGHNYLGFALFAQGKNTEAVTHLNNSNRLQESADSYRTLTLAHYLNGNHKMSAESLNRAFSLDEAILGDRDPMVAGIRSYAELGKFEVAHGLLGILLEKRPNIKEDQQFLAAGKFLRQKMIEAGAVTE